MSTLLIPPVAIMNAVSSGATSTSTPVHIMYSDLVSIQVAWTGTTHGVFSVKVSNTATVSTTGAISGGTWSTLDVTKYEVTGAYPAPGGSSGDGVIQFINLAFAFIELIFTRTDGTGTITASLTAKPL